VEALTGAAAVNRRELADKAETLYCSLHKQLSMHLDPSPSRQPSTPHQQRPTFSAAAAHSPTPPENPMLVRIGRHSAAMLFTNASISAESIPLEEASRWETTPWIPQALHRSPPLLLSFRVSCCLAPSATAGAAAGRRQRPRDARSSCSARRGGCAGPPGFGFWEGGEATGRGRSR